tara:strand:+ start:4190 stop:4891 length:702 start_codon:yes stop_codon:yes gene_type:complete
MHLRKPSPWKLSVRWRVLFATLFYRENSPSYSDIVQNIFESDKVRKSEFVNSKKLDDRFDVLSLSVNETNHLDGIIAEFGVYNGETLRHIAKHANQDREIYGFDSFEGLPEKWGALLPKGHFKTSVPKFENNRIKLQVGWFDETLPRFLESENRLFSLIHIDCDLYGPTKFVLESLRPRLQKGTIIVFDEYYGYPSWQDHEHKAWQEFSRDSQIAYEAVAFSSHSACFRITKS